MAAMVCDIQESNQPSTRFGFRRMGSFWVAFSSCRHKLKLTFLITCPFKRRRIFSASVQCQVFNQAHPSMRYHLTFVAHNLINCKNTLAVFAKWISFFPPHIPLQSFSGPLVLPTGDPLRWSALLAPLRPHQRGCRCVPGQSPGSLHNQVGFIANSSISCGLPQAFRFYVRGGSLTKMSWPL